MADNKSEIIKRLVEIRVETGLASKDFAAKAGIDPRNYSSIETGKRSLGLRVMGDICNAFGINMEWLRTGEGSKYASPNPSPTLQGSTVTMSREVFEQIAKLTETILSQQRTIETLSRRVPADVPGVVARMAVAGE